jgi:hypothetical protein
VDRFTLGPGQPRSTLLVPLDAVRSADECVGLYIRWTAGGEAPHRTWVFVPLPQTDVLTPERQSFGLAPDLPLPQAARALAIRYGQPISLEDVPADLPVTVVPSRESVRDVLTRVLEPSGLLVEPAPGGGLRIAPPSR